MAYCTSSSTREAAVDSFLHAGAHVLGWSGTSHAKVLKVAIRSWLAGKLSLGSVGIGGVPVAVASEKRDGSSVGSPSKLLRSTRCTSDSPK